MDEKAKRIAFWSYMPVSAGLALIFILLAGDKVTQVERYGGAAWVFLLTLIVTMPIFIPMAKKKYSNKGADDESMMRHH